MQVSLNMHWFRILFEISLVSVCTVQHCLSIGSKMFPKKTGVGVGEKFACLKLIQCCKIWGVINQKVHEQGASIVRRK